MTGEAVAAPGRAGWRDVDGILLLDKPEGLTSNAALQRARRAFRARKAGHTGSLDPLASGLLAVCFGQATKAGAFLLEAGKSYRFRLALGTRTSTGDRAGEQVETAPVPPLAEATVRRVAEGFLGESWQVPPMHSALRHRGERLYRLARKGIEVERPPRRIRIDRLEVVAGAPGEVELEVDCSKGTYVRTLAEDLAKALGTVGHVAGLRRLKLGPFGPDGLHTLDEVEAAADRPAALDAMLVPTDAALVGLPAVQLDAAGTWAVLHGQPVSVAGPSGQQVRIYGGGGGFLGIGRMGPEGRRLAPERLMVEAPHEPAQRA